MPEHIGQPLPLDLLSKDASHSWSLPLSHFHHAFFPLIAVTSKGVNSPFLVGCHCFANSGFKIARQFDLTTVYPLQIEHPFPLFLPLILASHSWSLPLSQFHHTFLFELLATSCGVNSPFLVGCHSFANSGFKVARQFDLTIF